MLLLQMMEGHLTQNIRCQVTLPLTLGSLLNQAYGAGQVSQLAYTEDAICFVWDGHQENLPVALRQYVTELCQ